MNTPPRDIEVPPVFPEATVVDEVLYDYMRRADRMGWSPYDLVDQDNLEKIARPERISEVQLGAVKTVLYVEDHLPGYLSEYLRIMTDPDVPDEQQIVNRRALHYTFRWVAEEDRHARASCRRPSRAPRPRPPATPEPASGARGLLTCARRIPRPSSRARSGRPPR